MANDDYSYDETQIFHPPDEAQIAVRGKVENLFKKKKEKVFFSRQIEVMFEDEHFHWITNRAIREMVEERVISFKERKLKTEGSIHLLWNTKNRYYKREAKDVVRLVDEYADPNIGAAIGLHGELMILEGFARHEFVMKGRNTKAFREKAWDESDHNLDFIFERDNVTYGMEVKNTLGYMDYDELKIKIRLCKYLGLKPVFVARMLPRTWINEIIKSGGFALILKYQLYPLTHKELAKRIQKKFGLPVDAPKMIEDGTMERFMKWHRKNV